MISIAGRMPANAATKIHPRHVIVRGGWSVIPISMSTAIGSLRPITATSGSRASKPAGLHITTVIGRGLTPGDGLGWMTRPGDTRPSTMAAGPTGADDGAGFLVHARSGRCTLPRSSLLWAEHSSQAQL